MTTSQYKIKHLKKITIISSLLSLLLILFLFSEYTSVLPNKKELIKLNKMKQEISHTEQNIKKLQNIIKINKQIENEYKNIYNKYLLDPTSLKEELEKVFKLFQEKYSFVKNINIKVKPSDIYINAALVRLEIEGMQLVNEQEKINEAVAILVEKFIKANKELFSYYNFTLVRDKNIIEYTFYKDKK